MLVTGSASVAVGEGKDRQCSAFHEKRANGALNCTSEIERSAFL